MSALYSSVAFKSDGDGDMPIGTRKCNFSTSQDGREAANDSPRDMSRISLCTALETFRDRIYARETLGILLQICDISLYVSVIIEKAKV